MTRGIKLNYLLAASIILFLLSYSICSAANLQENGFKLTSTLIIKKFLQPISQLLKPTAGRK